MANFSLTLLSSVSRWYKYRGMKTEQKVVASQHLFSNQKTCDNGSTRDALRLIERHGDSFEPMSEDAAKQVQRKLHFHIMFLFCCISLLLFVSVCEYGLWTGPHLRDGIDFAQIDKATLGASLFLAYSKKSASVSNSKVTWTCSPMWVNTGRSKR